MEITESLYETYLNKMFKDLSAREFGKEFTKYCDSDYLNSLYKKKLGGSILRTAVPKKFEKMFKEFKKMSTEDTFTFNQVSDIVNYKKIIA